jgi:hypothetical protein
MTRNHSNTSVLANTSSGRSCLWLLACAAAASLAGTSHAGAEPGVYAAQTLGQKPLAVARVASLGMWGHDLLVLDSSGQVHLVRGPLAGIEDSRTDSLAAVPLELAWSRRYHALAADGRTITLYEGTAKSFDVVGGLMDQPARLFDAATAEFPGGGKLAPGCFALSEGVLYAGISAGWSSRIVKRTRESAGYELFAFMCGYPVALAVSGDALYYLSAQADPQRTAVVVRYQIEDPSMVEYLTVADCAGPLAMAVDGNTLWVVDRAGRLHAIRDTAP